MHKNYYWIIDLCHYHVADPRYPCHFHIYHKLIAFKSSNNSTLHTIWEFQSSLPPLFLPKPLPILSTLAQDMYNPILLYDKVFHPVWFSTVHLCCLFYTHYSFHLHPKPHSQCFDSIFITFCHCPCLWEETKWERNATKMR